MTDDNNKHIDNYIYFVASHYKQGVFNPQKGWKKMQQHILPQRKVRKLSVYFGAAAAVALLLVMSVFYVISNADEKLVANADHTTFVLPDSSHIEMQEGAKLQYDKNFGKTNRRVSMSGNILFAVERNEKLPFIVTTPSAEIQVLGTQFVVDENESGTSLNVVSGKVQFTPQSPVIPLLCTAGMSVHYSAETQNVKVTSPNGSSMEINGKNKSLVFNNSPLKDVALVLSHFYNVQIELPEEESALTFTSSFTQKSVIEIINIINFTLDTHLMIE